MTADQNVVIRRAVDVLRTEFRTGPGGPSCKLVTENVDTKAVAAEFNMTPGAVHKTRYERSLAI